MKFRTMSIAVSLAAAAFSTANVSAFAQTSTSAAVAATAHTVVPALVPYSSVAEGNDGKPLTGDLGMTFLIFKDSSGGEPVWTETQLVAPDAEGRYAVQLGASSPSGLPLEVFANGTARWLEVQIAGQKQQPRVLLATVPYAAKAADAATLGGLPASAFALAGTPSGATATASSSGVGTDTNSTVTTPGGTTNFIPKFTGASTIANSVIQQSGSSIGIGKSPTAGATLDVGGAMVMRGNMTVSRTGNATSSQAFPSYGFDFFSNAYNSSTHAGDNPYFQLQSEPTGNNTSAPSATFNLLFANNGSSPAETGFYVNPNGTLHFASGQTFPGTGTGTITQVSAGTDLTGGGSSGHVTLNLDTSKVPTLATNNTFAGSLTANSASSGVPALSGTGTSGGIGVYGSSDTEWAGRFTNGSSNYASIYSTANASSGGWSFYGVTVGTNSTGIYSYDEGAGSYGLAAYAFGGADSSGDRSVGALGEVGAGLGVEGYATENSGTGVLGISAGQSSTGTGLLNSSAFTGGVWADTAASYTGTPSIGALVATTDDNHAGFFENNSNNYTTLAVVNEGSAGLGSAGVLRASSPYGSCAIGGRGDLTCTGQVKTLATTSGARMVETYAMQSPENWMEDFGSGSLNGGRATVSIDAAFAETANTGADYHVFLTPRGDSKGLFVANVTATGFEVRESGGGTSSLAFDYRIVAKRKGYEAQRMTDVTERFQAEAKQEADKQRLAAAKNAGKPVLNAKPRGPQQQGVPPTAVSTRPQPRAGN